MKHKSKLTLFRMEAGLTAMDVVRFLKDKAPLIDKTVISKAEHPDLYGVELSNALWSVLRRGYPEAFKKAKRQRQGRNSDRHKQTRRISARLPEVQISMLQQRLKGSGRTVQEFLAAAVDEELRKGSEA